MSILSRLPAIAADAKRWPWTEETDEIIYDRSIKWPKISIVTPSFNQGSFIEETIRSVLLQNYPNLEYIIIDGGSTDNTREVIKRYEPWLTYWTSEPDKGQSHAINKGIEKCTGEIFNWINSDDWYMKDTFFAVATSFIKKKSAAIVSGYENHISADGEITQFEGTFVKRTLAKSIELSYISQPSTFFRLSCIKQLGLLPENLHYSMDTYMWLRFLLLYGKDSFLKIHHPIVNFRFHQNSKTFNNLEGTLLAQNFLFERSSIMIDLQKSVDVPVDIRQFWIDEIFKTPKLYDLNIDWQFNEEFISPQQLKLYFVKRYINLQFQKMNLEQARWGIQQLTKSNYFSLFIVRSYMKFVIKKLWC